MKEIGGGREGQYVAEEEEWRSGLDGKDKWGTKDWATIDNKLDKATPNSDCRRPPERRDMFVHSILIPSLLTVRP